MGSNSKPQVVGFRYSFDIHFAIGLAIDELMEIRASGKTVWKGSVTSNQTIYINAPNLFGGDKGEGGIQGNLDVMFGEEDQAVNSRLAAALGGLVPAFRGFAGGFFSGLVTSIRIEDGTLSSGAITITALQDVFGLPANSYVPVPPSNWVPPDATPKAIATRRLMEVPYRDLAGSVDPANLALIDVTSTWLVALGVRPSGLAQSYTVTSRPGTTGSFIERGNGTWCPSALLVVDLPPGVTAATLTAGVDLDDVTVGMAALLDEEIVRVDAINLTTGAITLGRGCADTVEAQHAAGARLWFYDGNDGEEGIEYSPGVTVQTRLLTNTSQGQLDPALAGTDSIALAGRQGRPYPPGQFKIAGASYPASVTGDVVVTWAHRDRINQADQMIDATLGSIGPEAGTTYSVRLLRADTSAVLASQTGITSSTATLTTTYVGDVVVELWAVRDGMESWQHQRWTFGHANPLPP